MDILEKDHTAIGTTPHVSPDAATNEITSNDVYIYLGILFKLVLIPALAATGICTNIINIAIFRTMGLSDGTTQNFLILSVSDLTMSAVFLTNSASYIAENFVFSQGSKAAEITQAVFWTSLAASPYPQSVSMVTTVVIAVVRCCCVAIPLRVKEVLTPSRQLAAIFIASSAVLSLITFTFSSARLVRLTNPQTNMSRVAYVGAMWHTYDTFTNIFYLSSLAIAIVSVVVLTISLNKSSEFRGKSTSQKKTKERTRERKVVQSVVFVCVVFILGYLPAILSNLLRTFLDGFSHQGPYNKLYRIFIMLIEFFLTSNGCVNILIYYYFNTRYRHKLLVIFKIKSSAGPAAPAT